MSKIGSDVACRYLNSVRVQKTRWVLSVLGMFVCVAGVRSGPQFEVSQSAEEVKTGQTIDVVVKVTWDGDATQCLMGEIKCDLPTGIERVDMQPATSEFMIADGKPKSTYTYHSRYRPLNFGDFELDKLEVKFRLPTTQGQEWETWSPKSPPRFSATKPLEVPGGIAVAAAVVGGVLALGLLIFGITVWRFKSANRQKEQVDIESPYLTRLDDLRSLRIRGDFKEFFGQLAILLREYVKQKYGLKSDSDFVINETLEKHADSTLTKRIREVLELAENVRFGGTPPLPTDLDRSHRAVRDLIELNLPKPSSPEEEIAFSSS